MRPAPALLLAVLVATGSGLRAEEPPPPPVDARGTMLLEIIDTLERDLERLGKKKRELNRQKETLELQLARINEKEAAVERTLEETRKRIEKLLRSLVLMKAPDDLLLLFSAHQYHDQYVYNRVIRKTTALLAEKLAAIVSQRKAMIADRRELSKKAEALTSQRQAVTEEVESTEKVANRVRQELTDRTNKIAAIETLFMTSATEAQAQASDSPAPVPATPAKLPVESLAAYANKHQLQIPVSPGRVLKSFEEAPAPPYGSDKMMRGWIVVPYLAGKKKQAMDTAFVRTPFEGVVVFLGDIPGFGMSMVIDHGHDYHSVFCNLQKIHVVKGDYVERNQLLGTIKRTDKEADLPYSYYELRFQRIAIDPKPYFRLRPLVTPEPAA
jgi:septal ring factor EnvC (AmiA/AmiB activator)